MNMLQSESPNRFSTLILKGQGLNYFDFLGKK